MVVITVYCYGVIAVVLGSPFYGMLSEHIQAKLSQTKPPEISTWKMIKLIPESLAREMKKIAYYLPWIFLILVCSFIPLLNLATPIMWLVFGAWVQAIQYIDYPFDNNHQSFAALKKTLHENKTLSLSFGSMTLLFMMIPIINIFTIPAAVAGATEMWVNNWQEEQKPLEKLNANKNLNEYKTNY